MTRSNHTEGIEKRRRRGQVHWRGPVQRTGARLVLRKRAGREPVWVIKDTGGFEQSTRTGHRERAEKALAAHIERKFRPSGPAQASDLTISQVLSIYASDHAPSAADPASIAYAIDALEPFWGHLTADSITGATCRRYTAERGCAVATVRRELGVLRAALHFCAAEGYLIGVPVVSLPEAPKPQERWLTRQQVAILLWATRQLRIDGRRQMQRFILTSIYTGTRRTAALALAIDQPHTHAGWIDTERGVIYRMGTEERATAKRRTPARCPARTGWQMELNRSALLQKFF